MKSKSSSRVARGTDGRKHGNGNGHGDGQGRRPQAAPVAPPQHRGDGDVLDGQPPIETLLGGAGGRLPRAKHLDKATLLSTLLAFKKGDFSARLAIDLEGMD